MNKIISLLLFYSLTACIFLGIGSFFNLATPINILILSLVLPIIGYLYTSQIVIASLRSQHKSDQDVLIKKAKTRMLSLLTLFFVVGLFFFLLLRIFLPHPEKMTTTKDVSEIEKLKEKMTQIEQAAKQNTEVASLLQAIQKDLRELRLDLLQNDQKLEYTSLPTDIASIAGTFTSQITPTPALRITYIKIKSSQWPEIDVFEQNSPASRIVGQAFFGKKYLVLNESDHYYFINLDGTSTAPRLGWIHKQFVTDY